MNAKQRIVSLIKWEYDRAEREYRSAIAERAATIAAANAWDDYNPMDGVGGMSTNPYITSNADKRENDARVFALQMQEAYDLAVNTFLED